mmetsp:Transcript_3562/g.5159  ORF Transcript_3562/g.5159 Transcript_3562/m.5159 type:complete len:81 (+) Transcript_3562:707-949(+)
MYEKNMTNKPNTQNDATKISQMLVFNLRQKKCVNVSRLGLVSCLTQVSTPFKVRQFKRLNIIVINAKPSFKSKSRNEYRY